MKCSTVKSFFKCSCLVALVSMTIYWFYKFIIEDEDLCLVDYKAIETATDFQLPTVSMCFQNPFIDKKLEEIDPSINSTIYLQYLQGEVFDEKFKDIDYESVSFNLSEYHVKDAIYWRNGSYSYDNSNLNVVKRYASFAGFWFGYFFKCFGIEVNERYKKDVSVIEGEYKQHEFLGGSEGALQKTLIVTFHYPTQFLLVGENFKLFKGSYYLHINIRHIEILTRRSKHREKCLKDGRNYDNLLLHEYAKSIGCRAPYQPTFDELPECSNKEDMRKSVYELNAAKSEQYPAPCEIISNVNFDFNKNDVVEGQVNEHTKESSFLFSVGFPRQMKFITQRKAVDINTFVGNIGGYIGLFVGVYWFTTTNSIRCFYIYIIYIYIYI